MHAYLQLTDYLHCDKGSRTNPFQSTTLIVKVEIKRSFSGNIEQIVVPNLGDSITEGTVTSIHKQVGEKVVEDDIVLEIETDKVSVDIRAPKMGFIAKFFAEIDQDVEVGAPLYALSAEAIDGIDPASIKPQAAAKTEEAPAAAAAPPTPSAAPTPSPSSPAQTASSSQPHRVPMIKFRHGLRGMLYHFYVMTDVIYSSLHSLFHFGYAVQFTLCWFSEQIDKVIHGISKPMMASSGASDGALPFWETPAEYKPRMWKEFDIEQVNSGGAEMIKSNF